MNIIYDEKCIKVYVMKKKNYAVSFTLLDMKDYFEPESKKEIPSWVTMYIDVIFEDKNKNLKGEYFIDSKGKFQGLTITDKIGNKRLLIPDIENEEKLEDSFEKYIDGEIIGEKYSYSKLRRGYVNKKGAKAPQSVLTEKGITKLFKEACEDVTKKYNDSLKRNEDNKELEDIQI